MESKPYEGSHRELFETFLTLVDDSAAQTQALLDLTEWEEVRSVLSVGGGEGVVEATLLRQAPQAKLSYLDPSPEQCRALRTNLAREGLLDRVEEVAETTFRSSLGDLLLPGCGKSCGQKSPAHALD